ncbi:TetR/AcrR family transcriptional regulator C-terminal domain-containing protein [Ardenticatena maritima]|uniref:TetR/AcrR family transcriptional regulator C-terminal domain-containing protein n=1 Tax=Ardenticatena maritima TaxID=872965 RepID=UPI0013792718
MIRTPRGGRFHRVCRASRRRMAAISSRTMERVISRNKTRVSQFIAASLRSGCLHLRPDTARPNGRAAYP